MFGKSTFFSTESFLSTLLAVMSRILLLRHLHAQALIHLLLVGNFRRGSCSYLLPIYVQGDWMCHDCASGAEPAAASARPRIARQKLFSGAFALTRIEAIWQEPDGSYWFSGRWYVLPEETHTGRQVSASSVACSPSSLNVGLQVFKGQRPDK